MQSNTQRKTSLMENPRNPQIFYAVLMQCRPRHPLQQNLLPANKVIGSSQTAYRSEDSVAEINKHLANRHPRSCAILQRQCSELNAVDSLKFHTASSVLDEVEKNRLSVSSPPLDP